MNLRLLTCSRSLRGNTESLWCRDRIGCKVNDNRDKLRWELSYGTESGGGIERRSWEAELDNGFGVTKGNKKLEPW